MKKFAFLILILILIPYLSGMGEKPKETGQGTPIFDTPANQFTYAQEALAKAELRANTENVKKAVHAFSDFRELFPADKERGMTTLFFEAKTELLRNSSAKATELLTKYVAEDTDKKYPQFIAEAQYLLGAFQQRDQKYTEAISTYELIEKDLPGQNIWIAKARQNMADCYENLGQVTQSITVLEEALEKYPGTTYDQAYASLKVGLLYQKLGDKIKAIEYYKNVLNYPASPELKGPQMAAQIALEELQKIKD